MFRVMIHLRVCSEQRKRDQRSQRKHRKVKGREVQNIGIQNNVSNHTRGVRNASAKTTGNQHRWVPCSDSLNTIKLGFFSVWVPICMVELPFPLLCLGLPRKKLARGRCFVSRKIAGKATFPKESGRFFPSFRTLLAEKIPEENNPPKFL
jgi:hypothetical protein